MVSLNGVWLADVLDDMGIAPGTKLLVAFSGGVDSSALLWLLSEAQGLRGDDIGIMHLDHMLRGDDSDADRALVQRVAARYGYRAHVYRRPINYLAHQSKQSVELAARNQRYQLCQALMVAEGYDYIVLAHHKGDLTESILMHLIRGCGIDGLIGMRAVSGRYIRPLLQVDKSALYALAEREQIAYREDKTNDDRQYTRNYIRHDIMPSLHALNAKIDDAMLRLSQSTQDDVDFIQLEVKNAYKRCMHREHIIDVDAYKREHPAIRRRLLIEVISTLKQRRDIQSVHIGILDDWLCQPVVKGRQIFYGLVFTGGKRCVITSQMDDEDIPRPEVSFGYGVHHVHAYGLRIHIAKRPISARDIVIDASMFASGLVLRTRRSGDYIKLKGLGGHSKSLKKLYNEAKVPAALRKNLPILSVNDEVIWVKGLRASIYDGDVGKSHPVYIHIKEI